MLGWIIQISIISIIFIFIVHHLLVFFKTTLTVPRVKDLVNCPTQKYQDIYNTITINKHDNDNDNNTTDIDMLPTEQSENMKDELKSFLKKQLKKDDDVYPSGDTMGYASY
jgi:hypothetical protein